MQTLETLLLYKRKLWASILLDKKKDALIRNISTALVLALLLFAAYFFFHDLIFTYVISLDEIGYLLIDRLVAVGFLTFFIMLIISSFVAAIATLFRSDETEYLFSTPLPVMELFTGKYIDTVIYSSWAILIMGLPILFSYARIRHFGVFEYVLTGFLVLLPFVLTATSIGTIIAIIAMLISRKFSLKKLILLGVIFFSGIIYALIVFSQPTQLQIPFTEDFRSLNLFINNFQLNSNPFMPNFWFIQSLRALVLHDYTNFFLYAAALLSTAFFASALLYMLVNKVYFATWQYSLEESISRRRTSYGSLAPKTLFTFKPAANPENALLRKDILLFLRDPGQWAQLFLLFVLLAIYFLNIRYVPKDIEIEKWRTIIALMNLGFSGFVLATMAVRFIYPLISLEGTTFWVINSAPVSLSTLFRQKFLSAFITFLIITEPMALISGLILHLDMFHYTITIGGILLMSVSLSCLAVGFGAAFPYFTEQNPSQIASSPGGVLTIAISLGYLGLMMGLISVPAYKYTGYLVSGGIYPTFAILVSTVLVLILNAVMIAVPLRMGYHSLIRREY